MIAAPATRVDDDPVFSERDTLASTTTQMTSNEKQDTRETVVLLHGVGMAPWFMKPLARRLEAEGYRVLNVGYPSRTVPIEELASLWLPVRLSDPIVVAAPRVHFVAHSMGSLLVRHFMANSRPKNAGRVVMITPPNQGSALADLGRPRWFVRWFVGVNLGALGMSDDAFWRELPQSVDFPTGIIAGTGSGNPMGRKLPKPHDGTVTVSSTKIPGAVDSIELPWSHTGILFHRRTADEVVHFLKHGKFRHAEGEPAGSSGS